MQVNNDISVSTSTPISLPIECKSVSSSSKSRQFPMLKDFKGFWDESKCFLISIQFAFLQCRFFYKSMLQSLESTLIRILQPCFRKLRYHLETMCACMLASVSPWFANHLKLIVQQHSQVKFSCFWSEWEIIGTSVGLSTCGDGWYHLLGLLVGAWDSESMGNAIQSWQHLLAWGFRFGVNWSQVSNGHSLPFLALVESKYVFACSWMLLLLYEWVVSWGKVSNDEFLFTVVAQSQVFELVQWVSIYCCQTFTSLNSLLLL